MRLYVNVSGCVCVQGEAVLRWDQPQGEMVAYRWETHSAPSSLFSSRLTSLFHCRSFSYSSLFPSHLTSLFRCRSFSPVFPLLPPDFRVPLQVVQRILPSSLPVWLPCSVAGRSAHSSLSSSSLTCLRFSCGLRGRCSMSVWRMVSCYTYHPSVRVATNRIAGLIYYRALQNI